MPPKKKPCFAALSHDKRGVWQFKVSLHDCWRRIVAPADATVDELAQAIIDAFDFDDDHLYQMELRDRSGRKMEIAHRAIDDADYFTEEFTIGHLPLDPGQKMIFLYDFGDCWRFTVKLESIQPAGEDTAKVILIEKSGKAPPQYDNDEWE